MFLSEKEEEEDEEYDSNHKRNDYSLQPRWDRIVNIRIGEVERGCGGGSSGCRDGGVRLLWRGHWCEGVIKSDSRK